MTSWKQKKLALKNNHHWQAKPSHKIVVLDRGAIRFDIPEMWVVVPGSENTKVYDKQPPGDDCALTVSFVRLPPLDWSGLPLATLLSDSVKNAQQNATKQGEPISLRRGDLDIAWCEIQFIDLQEQREAISRICIGRCNLVQCLITFDFWVTDTQQCNTVWSTVLETLVVGEFIQDPAKGK